MIGLASPDEMKTLVLGNKYRFAEVKIAEGVFFKAIVIELPGSMDLAKPSVKLTVVCDPRLKIVGRK